MWNSNGGYGSSEYRNNRINREEEKNSSSGFQYDPYQESEQVKQAYEQLQQQLASKPGAYESQWQAQLNDTINRIMNREKFEYDFNADALYNQYKDMYTTQGQMAMMDTMGMASAMTGGYGNSYAQTVGQQVYQGYLQQLNDKVPELYQMALNKYQMEGDELYNQYALLGTQEEQVYGRYRDTVVDWNTALDRAQNQYNVERDYDYGKWTDNRNFGYNQYVDDRAYNYQVERDKVLDAQWQAEFDFALRQYEDSLAAAGGGGGGGGGYGSPDEDIDFVPKTYNEVKADYIIGTSSGMSAAERNAILNDAVADGSITSAQAQQIADIYNAPTDSYTAVDQMWDRHS